MVTRWCSPTTIRGSTRSGPRSTPPSRYRSPSSSTDERAPQGAVSVAPRARAALRLERGAVLAARRVVGLALRPARERDRRAVRPRRVAFLRAIGETDPPAVRARLRGELGERPRLFLVVDAREMATDRRAMRLCIGPREW